MFTNQKTTNFPLTTEQSNYESTHKVDEQGRAYGGKFTADSNRTESKVFTGSRDDPELAPENETAEVLEHGISSVDNHVDHEKSKGRKVKESGTYEDDASGQRTQRGTYTETLSDVSKVTDTWGKVHRYRHLIGTNPSNYQIEEAFKELQVDANIRNEEKYAGSYDLDGHKREKVGETISDRRHQLATQKVEFESAGCVDLLAKTDDQRRNQPVCPYENVCEVSRQRFIGISLPDAPMRHAHFHHLDGRCSM